MRASLPLGHRGTVLLLTLALALALAVVLGGCASAPKPARSVDSDGPDASPPQGLAAVPDAEPRVEAPRAGGPNRPYEVLGRRYVPITHDLPFSERGLASWYGRKFHGKPTASGEPYDMYAMTAAHPSLPLPSYARVRNPANGREVVVRINDRGPFHPGRIIDLSYTAALKLDLLRGVAPVEVERITQQSIRSGTVRHGASDYLQRAGVAEAARAAKAEAAPTPGTVMDTTLGAVRDPPRSPVTDPAPSTVIYQAPSTVTYQAPSTVADLPALPEVARGNGFWVQLGAFRQRNGAEDFQRRVAAELDWPLERLAVFNDAALFRLQAGPYASRDEARQAAERIRTSLQLVPVVLERR